MHTKKILSLQHPIVKHLVKLRENRRYRESEGRVFILGERIIRQIADHVTIHRIFSLEGCELPAEESFQISGEIMKKISGLPHPESLAAEVSLPSYRDLSDKKRLIALDGVQDPGNLGTLLRTALAFGFEGAILSPHCVDPFNDKAIRAAKGATFILPMQRAQLNHWGPQHQHLIADLEGKKPDEIPLSSHFVLILGNESHGPSRDLEGTKITLPMGDQIESLNVAIAGAILMYKLWERTT